VILIGLLIVGYWWCARRARLRGQPIEAGRAWCFGIGVAVWALASLSAIGVYAYVLFWVRALQVVLLLFVAPFLLATGKPLTVVRGGLGPSGRDRFDRMLGTRWARMLVHPFTTSITMLGTPWLLYLTPWYTASLQHGAVDALTRLLLVFIGFGYFYARLQADPVPHRYSQLISLLISVGETIGDGVLGLVIWQGPLIAPAYYLGLHRFWGPDQRLDQTIGAGVLWILGDVLGIPFVLVLMRALSRDERAHAIEVDAELDRLDQARGQAGPDRPTQSTRATQSGRATQPTPPSQSAPPRQSTLWWENDPQLRERFRRR
jgi:cytochrome c oxidase assembly factor CtaG